MAEPGNRWLAEAAGRASTYDDAWAELAAKGENVHGEADLVEWLCRTDPGLRTSVLDAGCGTGRVAAELARRGLDTVGVDLDPAMLERARSRAPELEWVLGDIAEVDLGRRFDVVVMAGNVMIFLEPGTEDRVVANLARHLSPGGVLVAGFELQPGRLDLATYDAPAAAAGLTLSARWATWDRQAFTGGTYAVSAHEPVATGR
jgi:SAM-dependent methyltransferase